MTRKFATLMLSASVLAGAAQADEVRVYNWSDYIDEELLGEVRGRDRAGACL